MASRAPLVWIALIAYSLVAVAIFSSTWIDPACSWIGSPKDPGLSPVADQGVEVWWRVSSG
jgi:hypothetical protein